MKHTTGPTRPTRARFAVLTCVCLGLVAGCGGVADGAETPVATHAATAASTMEPTFSLAAPVPAASPWPGGLTPDVVVPLGTVPARAIVAVDDRTLWTIVGEHAVSLDARTGRQLSSFPVEPGSDAITVLGGSVWVKGEASGIVAEYAIADGAPGARLDASMASGLVAAHGSVWIAEHRTGKVLRIDPTTGAASEITVVEPGRSGPQSLLADESGVLVAVSRTRSLYRIDAATEAVTRLAGDRFACGGMARLASVVWGTGCFSGTWVAGFDASTARPAGFIDLAGRYAEDVEVVGDLLVASTARSVFTEGADVIKDPGLAVLDPRTRTALRAVDLVDGGGPSAVGGGRLWVVGVVEGALLGFDLAEIAALAGRTPTAAG